MIDLTSNAWRHGHRTDHAYERPEWQMAGSPTVCQRDARTAYPGVRRPAEAGIMCAIGGRLKKGDNVENSRLDEVLVGLVYRARTDPAFRHAIRSWDPERLEQILLGEYRYDLTQEELEYCKSFAREAASENWSEERLDEELRQYADPIQDTPVVGPEGV